MTENIPALIAEARERHRRTARHLPDPTSPTLVSRLADALESLSAPSGDDREALIALNLATEIYTADDGYPATRVHSNETAADRVLTAGFRRVSPVTREDVQGLIAEARRFDTEPAEYAVRLKGAHDLIARLADALDALSVSPPAEVEWEYGECLLVDDNPDVYELHKGPWDEPRQVSEGYHLMKRTVQFGEWVPVSPESEGKK